MVGVIALFTFSGKTLAQHNKIDSLLNKLPKAAEGSERIDLLNALAFSYTLISVAEAEKFVTEAKQKSNEIHYTAGLAESFKIQGLIYFVRADYSTAVDYSYQALKLYESLGDKQGQSRVLNNLSLIFIDQKEYERAYTFATRSLKLKREIGDSLGVANSLLSLAEFHRHSEDLVKAFHFCESALLRFKSLHNDIGTGHAYYNMGEISLAQGEYPFALAHFHDALRYARRGNDNIQVVDATKQLGNTFLTMQQYDSAYLYLHQALRLAKEKKTRNSEMNVLKHLSDYFAGRGQLDSALYYTKASAAIEREIFNNQKQEQIVSLQMLYDFEKKEQEIAFQKKIVRRQSVAIVGVSLILTLSVIFGYRLYLLNKYNRMAKESLITLNAEINKINGNLETIVQERTEEIKQQNQKLIEYAFFTAHEVRGPLARILGLIELAKIKELNEEDHYQIMIRLENAATELDEIIRTISRKLENAKRDV